MSLKTLGNGLELLEYFKKESSWGVRELAKEMNLNSTVTHRLLTTFENYGYIVQDTKTKRYELGLKFLEFNIHLQDKFKFKDLVSPFMEKLAKETDETIFLTWLEGQEGLSIAIAESHQSIKFDVKEGTKKSLHAAASNLIILAHIPEDEQNQILSGNLVKFTDKTMTNPDEIKKALKIMKEQGWSCTYGETTIDVVGIGVPLFDCTGKIIGSLNVAGPIYRLPEGKIKEILELTLNKKDDIQNIIIKLGLTYSQIKKSL